MLSNLFGRMTNNRGEQREHIEMLRKYQAKSLHLNVNGSWLGVNIQ